MSKHSVTFVDEFEDEETIDIFANDELVTISVPEESPLLLTVLEARELYKLLGGIPGIKPRFSEGRPGGLLG